MLTPVERARRYVQKCQAAVSGQGGHDQTFHVTAILWNGFALSDADTLMLLREYNMRCIPPWNEGDLRHKVQSVAHTRHTLPRGYLLGDSSGAPNSRPLPPPAPKPVFKPAVLERIARQAGAISDISAFVRQRSALDVNAVTTVTFLNSLYPPESGECVLVFNDMQSQGQLVWRADACEHLGPDHLPAGPDGVWFLPQPVTGEWHPNPRQDGKPSRRSEEAVTSWRYLVLESDEADPELWLRALVQMPLRIVSICESGGRSIHALVRVDASSKSDWDALVEPIKPALIALGADRGALTAVRLTRLPQAQRGERVQRLLYLNPGAEVRPIFAPTEEGRR